MVSHLADETLPTKSMPRKVTIYLAAPPGDGLRAAREHFHEYVKPVLVAAAMDWDVVEGRKEGDVRYKTAERIRRKRKRAGEGAPQSEEEKADAAYSVASSREKSGVSEYPGIAGDIVIGRNTWKEYIRGLHEGWFGPVDTPAPPATETTPEQAQSNGEAPSLANVTSGSAVSPLADVISEGADTKTESASEQSEPSENNGQQEPASKPEEEKKEEKKEEEPPKPRQPPPYIEPSEYGNVSLSRNAPEIVGPSTPIRFPHLLGIRNTPIRIYRFLNRRKLVDDIGRQVALTVLASHRPYGTVAGADDSATSEGGQVPEQKQVLAYEERDWWKTTWQARKEHEESVWIEEIVLDHRLADRMQAFQLTAEDEDRAKRIGSGKES